MGKNLGNKPRANGTTSAPAAPPAPKPQPSSGKLQKLGALWLGKSQKGATYMSGVVTVDGVETRVVVFKNGFKEAPNHPDYVIYESRPQESQSSETVDADIPF